MNYNPQVMGVSSGGSILRISDSRLPIVWSPASHAAGNSEDFLRHGISEQEPARRVGGLGTTGKP